MWNILRDQILKLAIAISSGVFTRNLLRKWKDEGEGFLSEMLLFGLSYLNL